MKTILMTALLAGGLITGACSRKPPIVAAPATPEPTTAVRATPPPKSAAEEEAERLQQLAARAEADRLLVVPTPAPESAPIITGNDPGPGSGFAPMNTLDERKDPMTTGPTSGIAVEVVSISGKVIVAEVKTNGKGAVNVQLPAPGTYLVRYSSGPSKGKVIKTITATEAGGVNISVPPPSVAP